MGKNHIPSKLPTYYSFLHALSGSLTILAKGLGESSWFSEKSYEVSVLSNKENKAQQRVPSYSKHDKKQSP